MDIKRNPSPTLAAEFMRLCLEAGEVVGLRLHAAAWGEMDICGEGWRMITEKAQAALEAQSVIADSLIAGQGHLAPRRAVAIYRRRVRENQQRLSRPRPAEASA
jgi:hypothetical protein